LNPPAPSTLRLTLAPAPAWAALIAAVHAAAALAAITWLPGPGAALVCAGLALSAWRGGSAALLRGSQAVRAVELRGDGSAAILDAHGEWHPAAVNGAASLGHWCAALRLRTCGARRDVMLVPGALAADAFRRARVWVRWRLSDS
jgi:hypothetical protein